MDKTDKAYTPKEVNSLLDVLEITARKWYISLGYMFIWRWYDKLDTKLREKGDSVCE
ncbi:hypothetical protein [Priestia sp. D3YE.R1]|uniref:hypothetical protein n=1 Tax=Priestia sp. D3YE.R1 TaxID=3400416 RepID=UPI003BA0F3AA